jgi:hypothetical protein
MVSLHLARMPEGEPRLRSQDGACFGPFLNTGTGPLVKAAMKTILRLLIGALACLACAIHAAEPTNELDPGTALRLVALKTGLNPSASEPVLGSAVAFPASAGISSNSAGWRIRTRQNFKFQSTVLLHRNQRSSSSRR